jgi:putative DNA-invertase from lambdoid prophage Rac
LGTQIHTGPNGAQETHIRDTLIAFMAATAQAQAEATKEAQRAGIAHAKANGDARVYKGRKPSYSRKQFEHAQAMLGKSASVGEVARALGLTRQTVYRIKDDPAAAEAALATWGI